VHEGSLHLELLIEVRALGRGKGRRRVEVLARTLEDASREVGVPVVLKRNVETLV
jgi:hypothetical protein